jgi:hypothetical protein
VGPAVAEQHAEEQPWWKVMCLTGVDYFSTLSYLPGIAVVVAGALSPVATLLIVVLTLGGMLPMYRRVARESPHGQGSVAMLERLLPFWRGKVFVLVLLGFVATSWIITITISAADAAVHLLENPYAPPVLQGQQVPVTVLLLVVLGGIFLRGFREAVGVAVPIVGVFLGLNAVVIGVGLAQILRDPQVWSSWTAALVPPGGGLGEVLGAALLAFPLLVLGLSGFETGVSMMPLVRSTGATRQERLAARIRHTRRLLTVAAYIMSLYLLGSALVTTLLIPAAAFGPSGQANGRALAYLAHEYLGNGFGTVYDLSSVLILWFAGASAMAGLINIVPRYLPAYGMAPDWTRAVRPVVLVYTTVSILITVVFQADIDAQAGAYATGILAMMVSGTIAVTISAARARQRPAAVGFTVLTVALLYALVQNELRRPDGIVISACFILGIITVSLISRVARTTELRVDRLELDDTARDFITEAVDRDQRINLIAHRPHPPRAIDYAAKERAVRRANAIPAQAQVIFLEIEISDPSDFSQALVVHGHEIDRRRVLRAKSPAAPNAIAAIVLALRDATGVIPHAYFEWSEGNPVGHLMRYLLLGRGDTAPVVREIIRRNEPNPHRRPHIHVG